MASSPPPQASAPAPKRSHTPTKSEAEPSSPPSKKPKTIPADAQDDEFGDDDDGLDQAQLLAAVEAAESAAELASSSSQTILASAIPTSQGAAKLPSTPRQTTLFGSKPSPATPTLLPPKDASDLLWVERQTMDPAWFHQLETELQKDYFQRLRQFLQAEENAGKRTFPPTHLVHSWSRLTPLDRVKVVVVGQDPYHGPGQAHGLSFSVPKGIAPPPSLRNIYKELQNEYPGFQPPKHGCLEEWARQGVLLLNACLTVSAGNAGSHHGKGWENLTKAVLKLIAQRAASAGKGAEAKAVRNSTIANMFKKVEKKQAQQQQHPQGDGDTKGENGSREAEDKENKGNKVQPCRGVVFMVWGQPAAKTLAEAGITDKSPNILILRSAHPSPLSAHRGFLGNGHFAKANEWLKQRYGEEGAIDWTRL
ncbi:uracil DNA glycosylase [Thecaphora frezii]